MTVEQSSSRAGQHPSRDEVTPNGGLHAGTTVHMKCTRRYAIPLDAIQMVPLRLIVLSLNSNVIAHLKQMKYDVRNELGQYFLAGK